MKTFILALVVSASFGFVVEDQEEQKKHKGELWAVLVAGSASWFNYRHQADVCHAYQILKQHGVPDDHIIVMMKDDIANNTMNPHKGEIINRPGGPNVYEGVPKDYTGLDVTPKNLLKILRGEDMHGIGSGKTLKSGHKDRVFLNLVDHGAPGIFGFPTEFLKATDLSDTIKSMHQKKLFKEMVIYLESCESGSMFDKYLPSDINVYALTASNSTYSSFACYQDKELNTFLGDVFSIKWMEDSDKEDLKTETLTEQYNIVKKETTTSPVCKFGQMSIMKESVGDYQGIAKSILSVNPPPFHDACAKSAVSVASVVPKILKARIESAKTSEEKEVAKAEYIKLHKNREFLRDTIKKISLTLTSDADITETIVDEDYVTPITNYECYSEAVQTFHDVCFNIGQNPYAMRHVKTISILCDYGFSSGEISKVMKSVCDHPEIINIH